MGRSHPNASSDSWCWIGSSPGPSCIASTRAYEGLHAISGSPEGTFWNSAEKHLGQLRSELAYLNVDEMISVGLHEFLDGLQIKINQVGEEIHNTFFSAAANGSRRTAFVGG